MHSSFALALLSMLLPRTPVALTRPSIRKYSGKTGATTGTPGRLLRPYVRVFLGHILSPRYRCRILFAAAPWRRSAQSSALSLVRENGGVQETTQTGIPAG